MNHSFEHFPARDVIPPICSCLIPLVRIVEWALSFCSFWDKIKNFPVIFPFVIVFGRGAYQAGTFRTGVCIQVIIITYIIRILTVIFAHF